MHPCVVCAKEITSSPHRSLDGIGDCHLECAEGPAWDAFVERHRNPSKVTKTEEWTLVKALDHVRLVAIHFFRCRPEEVQIRLRSTNDEVYRFVLEVWHEDGTTASILDIEGSSRYISRGPISSSGPSVEHAVCKLLLQLKQEVACASLELNKAIESFPDDEIMYKFRENK